MSNTEWNPLRAGEYARWGEDVHVHHTYEEEEEYEEYDDEEYEGETTDEEEYSSLYEEMLVEEMIEEEMLADSIVRDVSLTDNAVRLSVSAPRLTISEGVPITFNYSDKATVTQEVNDGQLSLTIEKNVALQSIKICVNNRTWVIPLDAFPMSPPSMPKKR